MCEWSNPSCLTIRINGTSLGLTQDLYLITVYIPPKTVPTLNQLVLTPSISSFRLTIASPPWHMLFGWEISTPTWIRRIAPLRQSPPISFQL